MKKLNILDMPRWLKSRKSMYLIVTTAYIIFIVIQFFHPCFQILHNRNFPRDNIEKNAINIDEIFGKSGHNIQEKNNVFPNINNAALLSVMDEAKRAGREVWEELNIITLANSKVNSNRTIAKRLTCPPLISSTGEILHPSKIRFIPVPCGMVFGSTITISGKPLVAQWKYNPLIGREGEVSQFFVELQGYKFRNDKIHPPTLLHLNPRLCGDWSGKPIIEHNSRYGQDQWGKAQRCEGKEHDEKVDDQPKCKKWLQAEDDQKVPTLGKKSWWPNKVSHFQKEKHTWNYPFVEDQKFSLTIQAGIEGFHVSIDNRHISSFFYQPGFSIEETSGIVIGGDVDVDSIMITSLPLDEMWKALPLPNEEIELFVGIMSSSDHFAERMAIRKTWFQSTSIQSSQVVARFFVALHNNKDINLQLKREASYYNDIIILPFIDTYDIVVLKTLEICKFGFYNVTAKYIMKCDDDTFVRIDEILNEVQKKAIPQGLYMGNMNEGHWPLRIGKWAVTLEEWPEQRYPTYANGPGYVLSKDIVHFIVNEDEKHGLQLFKMEDVSIGLWVYKFAKEKYLVKYVDIKRFAQDHCEDNYLCAHYQSPRQMMCLWDKLLATNEGKCCYY